MKNRKVLAGILIFFAVMAGTGLYLFRGPVLELFNRSSAAEPAPHGIIQWPEGKRAAISLSFDDGRRSQVEHGIPILDRYGVKATFYLSLPIIPDLEPEWEAALRKGHEIGNHSLNHPCTINYTSYWGSGKIGLEEYTEEMIRTELDESNAEIEKQLGVRPRTFAYPCGQKFIGRGTSVRSYVPIVAEKFLVGRGWLDEGPNIPAYCDLAQVMGMPLDNLSFSQIRGLLKEAAERGQWLVLAGHDIGRRGAQSVDESTLEAICDFAMDPENGIWIDTIEAVGRHVRSEQNRLRDVGTAGGD